jgi:hypothetical protein
LQARAPPPTRQLKPQHDWPRCAAGNLRVRVGPVGPEFEFGCGSAPDTSNLNSDRDRPGAPARDWPGGRAPGPAGPEGPAGSACVPDTVTRDPGWARSACAWRGPASDRSLDSVRLTGRLRPPPSDNSGRPHRRPRLLLHHPVRLPSAECLPLFPSFRRCLCLSRVSSLSSYY